jgi:hypothetical protein
MSFSAICAVAYALACVGVIGFQFALIAGAPWGRLTQGGSNEGALPLSGRIAAGVSVVLLAAMALAILSAAGFWPLWPMWTGWLTLGFQAVVTALNWITPSVRERKLWAPITTAMLLLVGAVVLSR